MKLLLWDEEMEDEQEKYQYQALQSDRVQVCSLIDTPDMRQILRIPEGGRSDPIICE